MSTTIEQAPTRDASLDTEVVTSKTGDRLRSGADFITNVAGRLADRLDANAQARVARLEARQLNAADLLTADTPDMPDALESTPDTAERELRARDVLKSIGAGAMGALRATGEFAVGAGIVAGMAARRGIEAVQARKARHMEARAERKAERQAEREAAREARQAERDQRQAEQEARQQERLTQKAEALEARRQAAEARREARHEKWQARKDSLQMAISSAEAAIATTLNNATERFDAAVDRGIARAGDIKDAAVDRFTTIKDATVERATETGRSMKRGAEWLKTRVDDTRAIGAAAFEAAASTRQTLAAQHEVGQ